MATASCLCGGIEFRIDGELGDISYCHCTMCQKAHGAAFGPYARVEAGDCTIVRGENLISSYRSSPDITRTFCRICGSNLQFIRDGRPYFGLAAGILEGEELPRPTIQIWCESRAPWFEIDRQIPAWDRYPDER